MVIPSSIVKKHLIINRSAILTTILLTCVLPANAQNKDCTLAAHSSHVYSLVTTMPYAGPDNDALHYISTYFNVDSLSDEEKMYSRYTLRFIVLPSGILDSITIVNRDRSTKDTAAYTRIERSLIASVKHMKPWQPGKCGNEAVAVEYYMPIILCFRD